MEEEADHIIMPIVQELMVVLVAVALVEHLVQPMEELLLLVKVMRVVLVLRQVMKQVEVGAVLVGAVQMRLPMLTVEPAELVQLLQYCHTPMHRV